MRFLILVTFVFCAAYLVGCESFSKNGSQKMRLSSGSEIEIAYQKHVSNLNPTTLLVEINSETKILKEKTLDDDVTEVWNNLKTYADNEELNEAIIKYRHLTDDFNEKGEPEQFFMITVFSAEKIENGTWKIDKIG